TSPPIPRRTLKRTSPPNPDPLLPRRIRRRTHGIHPLDIRRIHRHVRITSPDQLTIHEHVAYIHVCEHTLISIESRNVERQTYRRTEGHQRTQQQRRGIGIDALTGLGRIGDQQSHTAAAVAYERVAIDDPPHDAVGTSTRRRTDQSGLEL